MRFFIAFGQLPFNQLCPQPSYCHFVLVFQGITSSVVKLLHGKLNLALLCVLRLSMTYISLAESNFGKVVACFPGSCQYFKFFNISEIWHSNTNGLICLAGIFILQVNFGAFSCIDADYCTSNSRVSSFSFRHSFLTSSVQMILLTHSITSIKFRSLSLGKIFHSVCLRSVFIT